MNLRSTTNLLLLAVSAAGLIGGIIARMSGEPKWADWIWMASTAPVLSAVVVGIARAVLRREAGLDLIALLSMGGAMALGEYLTGAVIGLMLASGRSLENFAEERARREMSALANNLLEPGSKAHVLASRLMARWARAGNEVPPIPGYQREFPIFIGIITCS